MPSLSITAPRFTDDDDRREIDGLTQEEKDEIDADLKGLDKDIRIIETETMKRLGALQMEEALSAICDDEKRVYLQALHQCAQVVQDECDPIRFLRATKPAYNPWEAARLLVNYWDMRLALFRDKAFFSFSTLESVLSAAAIELLARGVLMRLPDDDKSRAVIFVDRSLFGTTTQFREDFLQAYFYLLDRTLSESESAQVNGLVIIGHASRANVSKFDRKLSITSWKITNGNFLPIKIRAVHCCLPMLRPPYSFLLPVVKQIAGKQMRRRMVIHSGSNQEILASLAPFGFQPTGLPPQLFGTFGIDGAESEDLDGA